MALAAHFMSFAAWKRDMLARRGLSTPDGRPLYRYRLDQAEFAELEGLLRLAHVESGHLLKLNGFPCLFVLYGAEWWRQRFRGEQWEWRPILVDIGKDASVLSPSERSECVRVGLGDWGLRVSDRGLRYLGSLAIQGGLPLRLLTEARGGIGVLLSQVLRLAHQGSATLEDLTAWVDSLQGMLPKTYRQPVLYALLADVAWAVVQLKAEAKLGPQSDPIATLDAVIPAWRDRFPLSIEDDQAKRLIDQLVCDAAAVRAETQSTTPFQLRRLLVSGEPGLWRLDSFLTLPDTVRSADLVKTFGMLGDDLPYMGELSLTAGGERQPTTLRRLAGQDAYRLQRRPWRFAGDAACAEHVISLAAPDGRHWSAALRRGDELDDELPWVFTTADDGYAFARQGSGAVAATDALIAFRYDWTIKGDSVEPVGDINALRRRVARVRGTAMLRGVDFTCRIQTAQAGIEAEETYTWSGARLWLDFQSPTVAFRGMPSVSKVRADGSVTHIDGYSGWSALGTAVLPSKPLGPVEARFPATGEVQLRTRVIVLPDDATLRVEPCDAGSGALHFDGWQASTVRILDAGIRCESVQDGPALVVSLAAQAAPPEYITLEIFWRHTPTPARLRVPFPARGVRGFDAEGREMPSGSLLAAQQLAGVRLCVLTARENARIALEFGAGRTRTARTQVLRPLPGALGAEVRLQDYASDIQQLLATGDHVDGDVRMTLRIDGAAAYELRLAHYATKLEAVGETVALTGVVREALGPEGLRGLPVLAQRIEHPGDEPERLPQCESEGIPTGAWHFDLPGRAPGAWLIYPGPGAAIPFRPKLWRIPGEADAASALSSASAIGRHADRADAIGLAIRTMADDFDDPGWGDVERAAKQLGHLPLTTLDHWRCFARTATGMAALAMRLSSLPQGFLERFGEELPFAWESVPLSAWRHAIERLDRQCRSIAAEPAASYIFRGHLDARVTQLTSYHGALQFLLGIATATTREGGRQDLAGLQYVIGPGAQRYLFEGEHSELMRLRHEHAEDDWPLGLSAAIGQMRRDPVLASRLCPEPLGYADGVVNLPVLLAIYAATGHAIPGISDDLPIAVLRAHRAFDPDWFDDAYNQTVARCLSEALITS